MNNTNNCEKLATAEEAVQFIQQGDSVLVGGSVFAVLRLH